MGADAPACAALAGGAEVKAFFVRKETKAHGLQRRIEGPDLEPGERCLVVEDVVTTGGSTVQAIEAVRGAGYEVCGVVAILDRLAGGAEAIAAAVGGAPYEALATIDDIYPDRPGPRVARRPRQRRRTSTAAGEEVGSSRRGGSRGRVWSVEGNYSPQLTTPAAHRSAGALHTLPYPAAVDVRPERTVGHPVTVPTARSPAALLPAPVARTIGFALLATLGAAEWARMVGDGGLVMALPWVLVAVLAGETVRRRGHARAAPARPGRGARGRARARCSPRWPRGSSRGCSRPPTGPSWAPGSPAAWRR